MCIDLGGIFRKARLQHNLTSKDLLKLMGFNRSQALISRIEHNDLLPSPLILKRLIEILELETNFIVNIVKQEKLNKYRNRLNNMYKWL
jgi:transcriptional regulator with XRE-family HTH domain